jgi:hypothetical protein
MELIELNSRVNIDQNKKLNNSYSHFGKLLNELNKKELSTEIIISINIGIEEINSFAESEKKMRKKIKETQSGIIKLIEKELKLVTLNHYRNTWMAIGVGAFGVPIGVVLGTSLGNMGYIGLGMPMGMFIGLAIGSGMDKKAFDEERQLDLEIKY